MSALLAQREIVNPSQAKETLRVLLVPDSIHWVLGTIAKSIATANPISATIVSGPLLDDVFTDADTIATRFDLVHFLCPYASRDWLPRLEDKLPVVTSHHHVTSWELISHNVRGDAIVAGSSEWVRDLEARGADMSRVFRVPYGVDTGLFTPPSAEQRQGARAALGLIANGPVVGFFAKRASNDDDRKGTDVFVDAMMRLNQKKAAPAALIVGPGWQEMVSQFREQGIETAWIPFADDIAQLPRLYHALDFYWVTSRVEGGPVPLLEAMSSEVCCLSTAVGLAQEVIEDGENALLLPMNDAPAFADTTFDLWSDCDRMRAIGTAARQTMVEVMRAEDVAKLVQPAYDRAIDFFSSRNPRFVVNNRASSRQEMNSGEARRIRMLEDLAWAENLVLYQSEHVAAIKLIGRAWASNPLSILPLRVFLRRFLPDSVTRGVVAVKRKLQGDRG